MPRRKTTEEFINQILAIFGDALDCSEVVYKNTETPVTMKCSNGHTFSARPHNLLSGHGCPYCAGVAKSNTEEFIAKSIAVHGNRYSYRPTKYTNASTLVDIECMIHGIFSMKPNAHLNGQGCPECARSAKHGLIYGVGINDLSDKVKENGKHIRSYSMWRSMLERVYSTLDRNNIRAYLDVKVCDEWLLFSNFKKWFDSHLEYYHKGWHLDKDLLCRHLKVNKIYSPATCCFLPNEINGALITQKDLRASLPIGVRQAESGRFHATLCSGLKTSKHLGTFDSVEEAFTAYKETKEAWLKFLANKYKSELDPRAYEALMTYEVRIDD